MNFFIKEIFEKGTSEKGHRYFTRFGKGSYKRRFILSFNKASNVKMRASFELANDFVNFVKENKDAVFSGKILTKEKIEGKEAKKKAGLFVYELSESSLKEFENAYYYLLDVNSEDILLKIKKAIPKPGKNEDKIDDKFCVMDLDLKYLQKIKDAFFWDLPECKKAVIEHEVIITDIIAPEDIVDPAKMRELAKRKGKIIRRINCDGKEIVREKDFVC